MGSVISSIVEDQVRMLSRKHFDTLRQPQWSFRTG
jgi:hypothetical protein